MEKIIKKIAITGGPCAGKSTAINKIIHKFSNLGYKVLVIPETATELMLSGVTPIIKYTNDEDGLFFQRMVFKKQLEKEELYLQIAKKIPCDKIIILCDRGLLDGQAYIEKEDYMKILKENYLELNFIRESYDAVIHLVTTAIGAEKFYTLENNEARFEGLEEARINDRKVQEAWVGHSKLRIIDNSTDFEGKMNRLLNELYKILKEPVPTEIERKYLIEHLDKHFIKVFTSKSHIIQTYLKSKDPNIERRVRLRGLDGDFTYTYTEKITISGMTRVEREQRISVRDYNKLLIEADTSLSPIYKERYCFVYHNQYFELDYYDKSDKYAILEIELTSENEEVIIPNFIKVIKEVTDEEAYKNRSLAKNFIL